MKPSVEILDHIFSFLVSHRELLIACSKDPVLAPIVERHLYYDITVCSQFCKGNGNFRPDHLSKLVSENPRILCYVRVLRIQVMDKGPSTDKELDQFAKTLLMFPVLERIRLTTSTMHVYRWPDVFRAALEDRLSLPTVKEVHLVGNQQPFSLVGKCKNIENLLLGGLSTLEGVDSTPLQLKSLTLSRYFCHPFPTSINLHINGLQSLKWAQTSLDSLPELLGVYSETLNKLDVDLMDSCLFLTGVDDMPLLELSPVPPNLQQLTIRAPAFVTVKDDDDEDTRSNSWSYLPAAAQIINLFVSPPRHLILDIGISLHGSPSGLAKVDFSPLAVLGPAALLIPRIELYVHTDVLPSAATLAQLLSSLGDYEDITRSIKEGVLVIHSEQTAPDYVED